MSQIVTSKGGAAPMCNEARETTGQSTKLACTPPDLIFWRTELTFRNFEQACACEYGGFLLKVPLNHPGKPSGIPHPPYTGLGWARDPFANGFRVGPILRPAVASFFGSGWWDQSGWWFQDLLVLNVGNGWEWGNGIIINSYCGSFPHSLLSTNKKMFQFIVFPPYLGYLGRSQHAKPTKH